MSDQIMKLNVNAVTPDGEQIGCLGVRSVGSTMSLQPSVNINVGSFSPGQSGLGCENNSTTEVHGHIELIGCCGIPNTRSYWEFRNNRYARCPRRLFLLVEVSSNHTSDQPFPFVLRFNLRLELKSNLPFLSCDSFFLRISLRFS
jgi:hypothetical protein